MLIPHISCLQHCSTAGACLQTTVASIVAAQHIGQALVNPVGDGDVEVVCLVAAADAAVAALVDDQGAGVVGLPGQVLLARHDHVQGSVSGEQRRGCEA